jgi:hypothetical protein
MAPNWLGSRLRGPPLSRIQSWNGLSRNTYPSALPRAAPTRTAIAGDARSLRSGIPHRQISASRRNGVSRRSDMPVTFLALIDPTDLIHLRSNPHNSSPLLTFSARSRGFLRWGLSDACPHTSPAMACSVTKGRNRTTLNNCSQWTAQKWLPQADICR